MKTITKQELVKQEFNLYLYDDIFYQIEQMIREINSPLVELEEYEGYYSLIHLETLKAIIESYNNHYWPEERNKFWGVEEMTLDNFSDTSAFSDIKDECYKFNPIEIYNEAGELTELILMLDGIGNTADFETYSLYTYDLNDFTFLTADEIITKLVDLFKKYEDYADYEDKINNHIQEIQEIKKQYADYYNNN